MFDGGVALLSGSGSHFEEIVIELTRCRSRLIKNDREVLDTGSALNFEYMSLNLDRCQRNT